MRPTVRYEIAYVNALRARPASGKAFDTFVPIIGQMVQAEKELDKTSEFCSDNVKLHATMSRFIMLVNARFLLQDKGKAGVVLPLNTANPICVKNAELQSLCERLHYFRMQATSSNKTPENYLLENLGVLGDYKRKTLSNLTTWGLGEILEPPPKP